MECNNLFKLLTVSFEMATPEENRVVLERLLDRSTVNFHRFLSRDLGLGYNGTAFGAVCIGWGGYPSGGGSYHGYFDFRTREDMTLVIQVGGMMSVSGEVYLLPLENGRGHRVMCLPSSSVPDGVGIPSFLRGGGKSPYENVDPSLQIPPSDEMMPSLLGIIREVKKGEFWTIRKYALNGSRSESARKLLWSKSNFGKTVERAFSDEPVPGALAHFKGGDYTVIEMPNEESSLVLDPNEAGGERLSIPPSNLRHDNLEIQSVEVGRTLPVVFFRSSDLPDNPSGWRVFTIGSNHYHIYATEGSS